MCKIMFVAYIDFKQYCEKISLGYFSSYLTENYRNKNMEFNIPVFTIKK